MRRPEKDGAMQIKPFESGAEITFSRLFDERDMIVT
jgi:hypothetical protein